MHNYGSVIGVHDKSTQRAQQAQLWLNDHDRQTVPTGMRKIRDSVMAVRLNGSCPNKRECYIAIT
jgi:hypothetical protein